MQIMDKCTSIFISVVMPSVVKEQSRHIVLVVTCMVLDSVNDICVVSTCVGLSRGVGILIILWYVFRVSSARCGMSIYSSTRHPWYCILRVLWYCFIPVVNVVCSMCRSLLSLVYLNVIEAVLLTR